LITTTNTDTLGREGESRLPTARAPLNAGSIAESAAARDDGADQEGARRRRLLRGESRIGCPSPKNPQRRSRAGGRGSRERRLEEFAGVSNPHRDGCGSRLGPGSSWAVIGLSISSFFSSFLSLCFTFRKMPVAFPPLADFFFVARKQPGYAADTSSTSLLFN